MVSAAQLSAHRAHLCVSGEEEGDEMNGEEEREEESAGGPSQVMNGAEPISADPR